MAVPHTDWPVRVLPPEEEKYTAEMSFPLYVMTSPKVGVLPSFFSVASTAAFQRVPYAALVPSFSLFQPVNFWDFTSS